MTPTLRAELNRIEDFLMGPEGRYLGDILSALRGPDTDDAAHDEKNRTTVHIRAAAFPRLLTDSREISGARFNRHQGWQMTSDKPFDLSRLSSDHFRRHIRAAACALGFVTYPEVDARC